MDIKGKNIVITGHIYLSRKQAKNKIESLGAILQNSVNQKTDFLVNGEQDLYKFKEGKKESSNFLKAQKLIKQGFDIKILTESEFKNLFFIASDFYIKDGQNEDFGVFKKDTNICISFFRSEEKAKNYINNYCYIK